jgi:uncharacterized protein (TIGR03435 family)
VTRKRHHSARLLFLTCFTGYIASGQVTFEVASIKPAAPVEAGRTSVRRSVEKLPGVEGRLNYLGLSIRDLIGDAWRLQPRQIAGPEWIAAERFDIQAVMPAAATNDQIPEMLAALLAERFELKAHEERKEMSVYRLTAAKEGPQLQKVENSTGFSGSSSNAIERLTARTTLVSFAEYLSGKLDRPVLDETGLDGAYEFRLEWAPDSAEPGSATGASLFTAIQEQLGLRLIAAKAAIPFLVVDSIRRSPSQN